LFESATWKQSSPIHKDSLYSTKQVVHTDVEKSFGPNSMDFSPYSTILPENNELASFDDVIPTGQSITEIAALAASAANVSRNHQNNSIYPHGESFVDTFSSTKTMSEVTLENAIHTQLAYSIPQQVPKSTTHVQDTQPSMINNNQQFTLIPRTNSVAASSKSFSLDSLDALDSGDELQCFGEEEKVLKIQRSDVDFVLGLLRKTHEHISAAGHVRIASSKLSLGTAILYSVAQNDLLKSQNEEILKALQNISASFSLSEEQKDVIKEHTEKFIRHSFTQTSYMSCCKHCGTFTCTSDVVITNSNNLGICICRT
jgi:hypothetical protein